VSTRIDDQTEHGWNQAATVFPARVRALPSWLLARAARRSHLVVLDQLATVGLRKHHYVVLAALVEFGPAIQAELGRRLGLDRSDVVAVINDLERRRFVTRNPDLNDRRLKIVNITEDGERMLDRLDELVQHANDLLLQPLSPDERSQFTDVLTRLAP
jgi:DNA-binding MarR family transcriptional regulator